MDDKNDEAPFSYALSNDQRTLTMQFHDSQHEWSAKDVMDLIRFFAIYRKKMVPEIPLDVQKCDPLEIFQTDAYAIKEHPESGTAQVFLRMPGIGWALAEFLPDDCEALSKILARSIPQKPSTSH